MKKIIRLQKYIYLFSLFLLVLVFPAKSQQEIQSHDQECFLIMAGKNATKYQSVLLGHNNDLTGDEASYLKKFPRKKYDSAATITLSNGLKIPQVSETYQWMVLQTEKGFEKGDAVAINEHQVAIAGGVSLARDRNTKARKNDPLVDKGITAEIRYIALQRAKTARECVRIIGDHYNKYGISYPSGFGISDGNEVWYMEAGGGKHWAALKIPDEECWVQANGYRIDYVNPENANMMTSPGLLQFAKKNGMWDSETQLFSFNKAFGGAIRKSGKNPDDNTRRIWRAIDLIAPSLEVEPDQQYYPSSVKPDHKITIKAMIDILRDQYNGTPFYPYRTDTTKINERPIASEKTVHTSIIQLRKGLPAEIGAVLWTGLSSPVVTPYVPIYFGITEIPEEYNAKVPPEQRAFTKFKKLSEIYYKNPNYYSATFPGVFEDFQEECIQEQQVIDRNTFRISRSSLEMATISINVSVEALCRRAIDIAEEQLHKIKNSEQEDKEN